MQGPVEITDNKKNRTVTISVPHYEYRGFVKSGVSFETFYSAQLLKDILELKGPGFFKDEIDRGEEPAYVANPAVSQLRRFAGNVTGRMLDFGCGCGASAINLARAFREIKVTGIDIDGRAVQIAVKRSQECGVGGRTEFLRVENASGLPFAGGSFENIMCSAVIEHLNPAEREQDLRELWRVLKPGGMLFINGTPNRLWPKDGHTSNLWLVPYMPAGLACAVARRFSKKVRGRTDEELIKMGIVGETYWAVLRMVGGRAAGAGVTELNRHNGFAVNDYFNDLLVKYDRDFSKKTIIRMIRDIYRIKSYFLKPLNLPVCAFFPYLAMCLQKKGIKGTDPFI